MTKRALAPIALTFVTSVAGTAVAAGWYFGQTFYPEGVIVTTLQSAVLGEQREVIVHLPESYETDTSRRYPVLYVLDGSSQDQHTATSAALMARIDLMPQIIVVGVPNVSGLGRQRDYTPPDMKTDLDQADSPMGNADRFLAFLKTELIPDIDRRFRTTSDRMLAGHSRGGLFVAYSLMADPDLFQARFAHSPAVWREDSKIAGRLRAFLAARPDLASFFYMSLGTKEGADNLEGVEQVRRVFESAAGPGFRWTADMVPGAVHQTNGERATPMGFRAFYQGDPRTSGPRDPRTSTVLTQP